MTDFDHTADESMLPPNHLEPGDTDSKGHKYHLSAEYEQAQYEAFLESQGEVLEATIRLVTSQ